MLRPRQPSLAIKIPALLLVLLLAALAAMSVASYIEVRGALTGMASSRLRQAADQMANVFALSARQRVAAVKQLMSRSDVQEFLRSGDAALVPSIEAAVRSHLGTAAAIANVELWDAAGTRRLAVGAEFEEVTGTLLDDLKKDLSFDDTAIGRLRPFADGLRYPVGGRLLRGGEVLGFVVERRRISNPAQTRQTVAVLTGLIGNEATMLLGNSDGSIWSDLEVVVPDLPVRGTEPRLWEYQRSGRPDTFAWATPIAATPWAVVIEFPRAVVLAPSQRLLLRLAAIAAVLLFLAAGAGLVLSRRITTPLRQVTEAAEAVAASKPHVRLDMERGDEIGRLADSFNTMAEKVEQARADLESRVELRTAELRAANRELEAFSYTVSHDLRAPLRAIAGFVQILEEDHAETFDSEARRALDRVKANARRMGQLIDDLLAFSQIGRTTMLRQSVNMTSLAKTVATEAVAASGRAIDLTVEDLPDCYGEVALLNQVFVNLVSNAVKFTATTPHPAITIGSHTNNGETVYFVRDNGAGFDDRYAEKLFGVFQRLHRAEDFEGTGVGLAIVHRIITRHGGRVWAEGKPNGGATFYFTIPAKPA